MSSSIDMIRQTSSWVRFPCLLVATGWALVGCHKTATAPPAEKPPAEAPAEKQVDPRYRALPTPDQAKEYAPPPVTKTPLENGLTTWHMHQAQAPLVSIRLLLPIGSATDPVGKEGLTELTADMLDEGAGQYSALSLSDKLGELATDYGSDARVDHVVLSMEALAENLEESLALLADIVLRPRLSKDEFERRKKQHVAHALASRDDPDQATFKGAAHALFGEGYAGGSATPESLESITYAEMKAHAKRLAIPEGAHIAIAGMNDQAEALESVRKAFGKWTGKPSVQPRALAKQDFSKKAFVIDFPEASQSSLLLMTGAGPHSDPNHFAETVMNEKVGSSFTSRINMNLREDKGYTYGASSFFKRYEKTGFFGVFTNVKSEATGASIREVFTELASVCEKVPLTEAERNESVEGLLLGYPMQFDQVSSLGERLITLPERGRPADYWQTWPKNIQAITTATANQAATPYCNTSSYGVVVAGNKSLVQKELEALGLTVVDLDRDGHPVESSSEKKE